MGAVQGRRALVEQYIPYVRSIAGKIKRSVAQEISYEDLVEYGMVGLLEAADRFDAAVGANFMTFAYYRIRGAIYDGLRGMGWMRRADYARARFEERANHFLAEMALRGSPAEAALLGEGKAAPGAAAASAAQRRPTEGNALEAAVGNLTHAVHGLAAVYLTHLDGLEAAQLKDEQAVPVEESMALQEARALVRQTIRKLSDQERKLLEMYYYKNMSLKEVGDALGLSKSWTSRLHARTIDKLHRLLATQLQPS